MQWLASFKTYLGWSAEWWNSRKYDIAGQSFVGHSLKDFKFGVWTCFWLTGNEKWIKTNQTGEHKTWAGEKQTTKTDISWQVLNFHSLCTEKPHLWGVFLPIQPGEASQQKGAWFTFLRKACLLLGHFKIYIYWLYLSTQNINSNFWSN